MVEKQRRIEAAEELERQKKSVIASFGQFRLLGSIDMSSLTDPDLAIEIESIADSSVVFLLKLNSFFCYRIRLPWKNSTAFHQESLVKDSLQRNGFSYLLEFSNRGRRNRSIYEARPLRSELVIPWVTILEGLDGPSFPDSRLNLGEPDHLNTCEHAHYHLRDQKIHVKTASGTEARMRFILEHYKNLESFFRVILYNPKSFWRIVLYRSVFIKAQTILFKFNNQVVLNLEARKGSYLRRSELKEWRARIHKLAEIPPPKNLLLLKMSGDIGSELQNPLKNKEAALIWNYYDLNGVKLNFKRADLIDEVVYDDSPEINSEDDSEQQKWPSRQGSEEQRQRDSQHSLESGPELGEEEAYLYKDAPVMSLNFCTFVAKFQGEFWLFLFSMPKEHYSRSIALLQRFKHRRDMKPLLKSFDAKIFSGQKQSHLPLDLRDVNYLENLWNEDRMGMLRAVKHFSRRLKPSKDFIAALVNYFRSAIHKIDYQGIIYKAVGAGEESEEVGNDEEEVSNQDSGRELKTDAIKMVPMTDEREEAFQLMIKGKEQNLRMAVKDTLFVHYNTVKRVQQRERLFMTVKYRSTPTVMQTKSIP